MGNFNLGCISQIKSTSKHFIKMTLFIIYATLRKHHSLIFKNTVVIVFFFFFFAVALEVGAGEDVNGAKAIPWPCF